MNKRFCHRGHDLRVVGTYSGTVCVQCRKEYNARNRDKIRTQNKKAKLKKQKQQRASRKVPIYLKSEASLADAILTLYEEIEACPVHWERDAIRRRLPPLQAENARRLRARANGERW